MHNIKDEVNRFKAGLTTTQAPFIEEAQQRGDLYIFQPYDLYSEENHDAWRRLFARMLPRWDRFANRHFLAGINALCLDPKRVPRLDDVNKFLEPLTGFKARAVSGYVPAYMFFDSLRRREFPTTITIRSSSKLDYLPEPDIFHDVSGHVPMHTDPHFAETLVRFGEAAALAAEMVQGIQDERVRLQRLSSIVRAMARFFWFTIEFGLMKEFTQFKVYGSGLLSSFGEIAHSVDSPDVQRYPIQLEWIINQGFEIDHYQPLLFWVEGFDHLYSQVDLLIEWLKDGKLNNVAAGEPTVTESDLKSFLTARV